MNFGYSKGDAKRTARRAPIGGFSGRSFIGVLFAMLAVIAIVGMAFSFAYLVPVFLYGILGIGISTAVLAIAVLALDVLVIAVTVLRVLYHCVAVIACAALSLANLVLRDASVGQGECARYAQWIQSAAWKERFALDWNDRARLARRMSSRMRSSNARRVRWARFHLTSAYYALKVVPIDHFEQSMWKGQTGPGQTHGDRIWLTSGKHKNEWPVV